MVAALSALSIISPYSSEGAEYRIQPGITLGEEYNDNIFLEPENESSDFISRIAPSINILYGSPLWDWNVNAFYEYRYYHRFHDNIQQSNIPNLNLTNQTRITERMFLDITENYARTSLTPVRDYTQESTFINQTDRNVLTVNPYLKMMPTSQMTVTTGYMYTNTWYKDPRAIDQINHSVYTGFQQDLTRRTFMFTGIKHTLNRNKVLDYTQDDVFVGLNHEYIENSTLSAAVGNSWFRQQNEDTVSQVTWDVNMTHRYSTMTVIYETGLRFIPDPYRIARREDRYVATISRSVQRTSLTASGGLYEYRNIRSKHLEYRDYRVVGTMSHAVTTKSNVILSLNIDWAKDYLSYIKTQRYLTGVRFEHFLKETLTLALDYRYTYLYSPDDYWLNYVNNRVSIEIRKVF